MQFKNIIVVALASVAAALPTEDMNIEKRTTGQDVQNQCSNTQTAKCCSSLVKNPLLAVLNIGLLQGLNCLNIPIISVLGTGQCSGKQAIACCSSGTQYGLVNIGNACVPVVI